MLTLRTYSRLSEIPPECWQRLGDSDFPFLQYPYLEALEQSGAVCAERGWQPHHLGFYDGDRAIAFAPCYIKHHSRGEYVFDWSWADLYRRLGLAYYPKLLCAIPFTPCPGPRWVGNLPGGAQALFDALSAERNRLGLHSWHLLFPDLPGFREESPRPDVVERNDCQYHWHNPGFATFDDFLAALTASKRKTIRRERRKVREAGVQLQRHEGATITQPQLDRFYRHYCRTYQRRGQSPYLDFSFFTGLQREMPAHLMLIEALREGHSCGAALFLRDATTLYGRWWGGDPSIDCLHFEACYYQGIDYAIREGLARFDPGTQGEHKLIRGFAPTLSRSYHQLQPEPLHQALRAWCEDERRQVAAYMDAAAAALPYARR